MDNTSKALIPYERNLLIIGGSGRNVGKTSLALMLFERHKHLPIFGMKVSSHRKDEEQFHGTHDFYPADSYKIIQESCIQPWKDTARMVEAGAEAAYYIEAAANMIALAYDEFIKKYNLGNHPVICESRSLRKHIKPGVYVLLLDPTDKIPQDDLNSADLIYYYSEGLQGLRNLSEKISYGEKGWSVSL